MVQKTNQGNGIEKALVKLKQESWKVVRFLSKLGSSLE